MKLLIFALRYSRARSECAQPKFVEAAVRAALGCSASHDRKSPHLERIRLGGRVELRGLAMQSADRLTGAPPGVAILAYRCKQPVWSPIQPACEEATVGEWVESWADTGQKRLQRVGSLQNNRNG